MTSQDPASIQISNKSIHSNGIVIALTAFILWGFIPLYFRQLTAYNATEIVAHRVIWIYGDIAPRNP